MGRRRWKGVSKEERTTIARKAVEARWAKVRQAQDVAKPSGSKGSGDKKRFVTSAVRTRPSDPVTQ
jgi:hypothetical protein